jgi:hypothetical protein
MTEMGNRRKNAGAGRPSANVCFGWLADIALHVGEPLPNAAWERDQTFASKRCFVAPSAARLL